MTLDLSEWKQTEELEFEGTSHEKITMKKYIPYQNRTAVNANMYFCDFF